MSEEEKRPVMDRRGMFKALVGRGPKEPEPVTPESPEEPDPRFEEGSKALEAGEYEAAVAALRPYVRSWQRHVEARRRLGRALFSLGSFVQAKVEFETVLRRQGEDALSRAYLGLCLWRMGKEEKALAQWDGLVLDGLPAMEKEALDAPDGPARLAEAVERAALAAPVMTA